MASVEYNISELKEALGIITTEQLSLWESFHLLHHPRGEKIEGQGALIICLSQGIPKFLYKRSLESVSSTI